MTGKHYHCDVLVVGAGLAGLSAARAIEAHNRSSEGGAPLEYLVVEAGNKAGYYQSWSTVVPCRCAR